MFARTPPTAAARVTPDRLFIICHNEHKNSTRPLSTMNTLFATPTVHTIKTHSLIETAS